MPINPDLLIAAPILQDSFVDKDGSPMSAGIVTCYRDNSRTTLKNWYYQSSNFADSEGKYTFSPLPNPLTLSAAGTICDINGVDTIPFFYPYSELDQTQAQPYYITIVNHAQTNQITRPNFPYNPHEDNPDEEGSVDNYVINNVFWRNAGTVNLHTVTQQVVCPSQHDGFRYPDVQFIKNNTNGLDTLTFTKFALTAQPILTGDITPEFYINHTCSNAPTGETQKCYQFPISLHVNTLNGVQYTVTIQAQNAGGTGTGENVVTLFILQDTGTGTSSPAPFPIGSITVNSAWTKYEFTTTFPTTAGLTLSSAGDDALYLQVQMPLNVNCSINFAKPSIYLTNASPTNSFETYDQVDAIINSPRTGDLRTSINSFYYFGWVPMNDQTIGNSSSSSITRANQDTWQLFNLMWSLAQPYDTGSNFNAICQMYTSSSVATNYGVSAIADFNANKQLALTKIMGRVMMGTVPLSAVTGGTWTQGVTVSNSGGNILCTGTNGNFYFQGQPITFSGSPLPVNIVANAVYFVTNFNSSGGGTFNVATTYANAIAGTPVVAFSSSGTSVQVMTNITATQTGEYYHTQLLRELVSHTHPPLNPNASYLGAQAGASVGLASTFDIAGVSTTGATGGGSAFNITQPGVFYNIYIKL